MKGIIDGVVSALQAEAPRVAADPSADPSDNRCVATDIRLRPGDAWTVQGDVVTVVPL